MTAIEERPEDLCVEDAVEALEDGDRPLRGGAAWAALQNQTFRRIYTGAFLSNVGSWMQNVLLGALAYDISDSATFVGLVLTAQLGPILLFSLAGGMLADTFDRKKLLTVVLTLQGLFSLALALVVRADDPNRGLLLLFVFLIGVGQSVFGPTYSALLPSLVGQEHLPGAISLNSAQMNGSRVIGPILAAPLAVAFGIPFVFMINAATYLFVIGALLTVTLPEIPPANEGSRLKRFLSGFTVAKQKPVVGRSLVIMVAFSLGSLPFVGQLPVIADRNYGISEHTPYLILYSTFGVGAMLGALSIGTVFTNTSKERLVKAGLLGFAVALAAFGVLEVTWLAYPVVAILGFFYFATVTALSTVFQTPLVASERGRVMALWMMAFGGTVPFGNLAAGPIIDSIGVPAVLLFGAVLAVALAYAAPKPVTA